MRDVVQSIKGCKSDRVKLAIQQVQNTPLQVKVLDSKLYFSKTFKFYLQDVSKEKNSFVLMHHKYCQVESFYSGGVTLAVKYNCACIQYLNQWT